MKVIINCDDKYEAQKLASLIFIKEGKETYITSILNIIKNELVISLKDKSAHSVVLKDEKNVERFADFIQSVFENEHSLTSTMITEDRLEIIKEWIYGANAVHSAITPTIAISEIPNALKSPSIHKFLNYYN